MIDSKGFLAVGFRGLVAAGRAATSRDYGVPSRLHPFLSNRCARQCLHEPPNNPPLLWISLWASLSGRAANGAKSWPATDCLIFKQHFLVENQALAPLWRFHDGLPGERVWVRRTVEFGPLPLH
jgi:hypothetical protein